MAACREWAWPGGYLATARECRGMRDADLVLTVNPGLRVARLAEKLGKRVHCCENGWDAAAQETEALPPELRAKLSGESGVGRWLYVGRGDDVVKAADRVRGLLRAAGSGLRLVAAPGAGFESESDVLGTGRLTSAQVLSLFDVASGLLIPSRYEGNSLAILEALGRGLPVVATAVGSAPYYASRVEGLILARSSRILDLACAVEEARARFTLDPESRRLRAERNRVVLPSWRQVAESLVKAVMAHSSSLG